ncbi:unnamed protein product [Lactuca virosa]|uniref:Chromo domain-containing protein n=1 Tax=Lactuca virosa TaxID=75947 RepID=A0AAU9LMD8_9ASTR|nr:unnamed protein product [Lactuca virosa]
MDPTHMPTPKRCLAIREISKAGHKTPQWLIQWDADTTENATWEDAFHIQSQFPEFKLEDKLAPLAGGIDKEDVGPELIQPTDFEPKKPNTWKVEILMGLEEEFGISVEEESVQIITTVRDVDLIEKSWSIYCFEGAHLRFTRWEQFKVFFQEGQFTKIGVLIVWACFSAYCPVANLNKKSGFCDPKMEETPFREREKQILFQSIQNNIHLKGPMDKIKYVDIPLALASSSLFLIVTNEIISKIEEAATPIGFYVKKYYYKLKLQGEKTARKGHLSVATEVVSYTTLIVGGVESERNQWSRWNWSAKNGG